LGFLPEVLLQRVEYKALVCFDAKVLDLLRSFVGLVSLQDIAKQLRAVNLRMSKHAQDLIIWPVVVCSAELMLLECFICGLAKMEV
jgi:hypothetical protein